MASDFMEVFFHSPLHVMLKSRLRSKQHGGTRGLDGIEITTALGSYPTNVLECIENPHESSLRMLRVVVPNVLSFKQKSLLFSPASERTNGWPDEQENPNNLS